MRRFYASKFFLCLCVIAMTVISGAQPAPRAGRAVTALRTITVVSEPKARVWIDGVFYGRTDGSGSLTIRSIASGGHMIRVRADGFRERSLPLTSIQRGEIRVPLVKATDEAELAFQEAERLSAVDREKAIEAYRRSIRLRPNYPEAYLSMARVLTDAGDVDEALKAILTARRLRRGFAEASAVEGRILRESGEEAKAIAAFRRAIAEGRGFQPEAYTGLGMLYKEKAEGFGGEGDFANEEANYIEAAKYFQTALKQLSGAPDAIVLYQLLGLIYERQKKNAEAIAVYEDFLRFFPDAPEATAVRSFIVQLKKDAVPKP